MPRRTTLYPPLPPVSPVQLALLSSPPPPRQPSLSLSRSPAHYRSILLSAARPRYPVPYVALSPNPRSLSLAFKLALAPREPGPLRLRPSNPNLIPIPKSKTLSLCPPLSFQKNCTCPLARKCGNWKPTPPMPKSVYNTSFIGNGRAIPEMPRDRLYKVLYNEPIRVSSESFSIKLENHALKRRSKRS